MPEAGIDLAFARRVIAERPCSALVGAEVRSFGPDGVTLEIPIRPELEQQHGHLHGGCWPTRPTTR